MGKPLTITWKIAPKALDATTKREKSGTVVRRLQAMRLLLGETTVPEAAERLGVPERSLRRWVHRFNRRGPEGLRDLPRPGQPPKLALDLVEDFKERVRSGAQENGDVCALRGRDFRRILAAEYDAEYSLGGVYFLLRRLGFSSLVPRPRHPQGDDAAREDFKKTSCQQR